MATPSKTSRLTCGLDFGFAFTLFGYQLGISFDLTEWHLSFEHVERVGYMASFGPFYIDVTDATVFEELPSEDVITLQDMLWHAEKETAKYFNELEATKKALEQETVRLAACGVAALGYGEKLEPEVYGYSASYSDIYNLRLKYNQALKEIEKLRKKLGGKNVKGKSLPSKRSTGK